MGRIVDNLSNEVGSLFIEARLTWAVANDKSFPGWGWDSYQGFRTSLGKLGQTGGPALWASTGGRRSRRRARAVHVA